MSEIKSNGNSKSQTLHEEESQNPSGAEVSLDNADTVIEGAPGLAVFETWDQAVWGKSSSARPVSFISSTLMSLIRTDPDSPWAYDRKLLHGH